MRRRLALVVVVLAALLAVPAVQIGATGVQTHRAQAALLEELEQHPATDPATTGEVAAGPTGADPVATGAAHGRPLAVLEIPRLGDSWRWAVLEGTDDDVLADGVGHYPGTPLPGDAGNVALAGHRAGHGSPFLDFDELRAGDEVRIGQGPLTWTYRLTSTPQRVDEDADWVLDPLPGHRLTLTTCWPKYGSLARLYVRGELTGVERTDRPAT